MPMNESGVTSSQTRLRVVTIVLNTNRRADTLECLTSLAAQSDCPGHHVIVLDNQSSDGSVEAIRASFPDVQILPIEADRGYAGNNNVGLRAALAYVPDWILILNEDTVLDPSCLAHLLAAGGADPAIGMVGPLVFHHDEPTVIQSAGGRLSRFWESVHLGANQADRNQFTRTQDVDWVSGCALLVRRALIERVGTLDERFYYYWEETEWCVRAKKAGWRIILEPAAKLWHKGVRRDYKPSANVTYYNTRNRLLMMSTQHPPIVVWVVAWWQTLRTLLSWTLRSKWRSDHAHRDAMWQGVKDFLLERWGARPS
jgi:GT2 family glycosyltransferase